MFDGGFNISQVLPHEKIQGTYKCIALKILRRLCGTFGRLPNSCLIGDELKINDGLPVETHAYADLRRGVWKDEDVAVKLLRFAPDDDRAKITKVSSTFEWSVHIRIADARFASARDSIRR